MTGWTRSRQGRGLQERLQHHVTGAIQRGEAEPITAQVWERDPDTREHSLTFGDGGQYMVAYRTPAGDYAITCRFNGDPCGGDVEYYPTLRKAKEAAETHVRNGTWRDLTLPED